MRISPNQCIILYGTQYNPCKMVPEQSVLITLYPGYVWIQCARPLVSSLKSLTEEIRNLFYNAQIFPTKPLLFVPTYIGNCKTLVLYLVLYLVLQVLLRDVHVIEKVLGLGIAPRQAGRLTGGRGGGCSGVAVLGAPLEPAGPAQGVSLVHSAGSKQDEAGLN